MCLEQEALQNFRGSHGFLLSDLHKMLVDMPQCNRVCYFRKATQDKITLVPTEAMGGTEAGHMLEPMGKTV